MHLSREQGSSTGRLFACLVLFGVAFGFLEATVVVYLRQIYYPEGFQFPIILMPDRHAVIEIIREAATIVMLCTVAGLAGRTGWERFGHFALLFGIWDITFYLGLKITTGWPDSLLTWDLLFLIPLIWTGPVLAPVLISLVLIAGGGALALRERSGRRVRIRRVHWLLAAVSLLLLFGSFVANHNLVARGSMPESFPWLSYWAGLLIGTGMAIDAVRSAGR